jgi:hypothetical protein
VSNQEIRHALRNCVESGVLLVAAAMFSLAVFQGNLFSGHAARYVAFWLALPATWLVAMWFTRVVREFLLARYDDLGSTPRRVVAGGAVAVACIAYLTIITSNIPERQRTRDTQPEASLALIR